MINKVQEYQIKVVVSVLLAGMLSDVLFGIAVGAWLCWTTSHVEKGSRLMSSQMWTIVLTSLAVFLVCLR